jgi:quercetin dioxygenase-like cupin family protein
MLFAALFTFAANAQDSPFRKELKRADLTGTSMEVVTSISEIKPGETSTLHVHHGEETFYVLEGGTVELPDGKQVPLPAGTAAVNVRDVPHGAFKVVGDKGLKLLTVHIVDKGKPLYDAPPPK